MAEKQKRFKGDDFKIWQQKLIFSLTTLNLTRILKEDCLITPPKVVTPEIEVANHAWMNTNFLFCNYIFISAFEDTLYDVYCNAYNTSKLL